MAEKRLIALVLLLLFSACSSERKRGDEFYEKGAFMEAVGSYERALKEDPNDADAAAGLQRARDSVIDRGLIQVRLARLGGNSDQALELLHSVITEEGNWKHFPGGKVAFTQDEEAQFAFPYYWSRVKDSLSRKLAFQAQYRFKRYLPAFQRPEYAKRLDDLRSEVDRSGVESCKVIQKKEVPGSYPYYAEFVDRYCAHWGQSGRDRSADELKKLTELYGHIELKGELASFTPEVTSRMRDALKTGIESSPWSASGGGKVLPIEIHGGYVEKVSSEFIPQAHSYFVDEPYTEFETVTRTRYDNGQPVNYTEQVSVTKYHSVAHTFDYQGTRRTLELELRVQGMADFGVDKQSFEVSDKKSDSVIEHDYHMPAIGLYPSHPNLPDSSKWNADLIRRMGDRFGESVSRLWVSLYCRPEAVPTTPPAAAGDAVHRCLRANSVHVPENVPAPVREWYERELGVTLGQAEELMPRV